jgi:hypothetical protein
VDLVKKVCLSKDDSEQKTLSAEINRIVFKLHNLTAAETSLLSEFS